MKQLAQSLGLGLALLAASTVSPRAADWAVGTNGAVKDFGSIKDYKNAAVPVPAPTPASPFMKDWYVRGDLGYTFSSDTGAEGRFGITARDELGGFLFGSIGAGRYITPSIRAEMSFDFRPKKVVTQGYQNYERQLKTSYIDNAVGSPTYNHTIETTSFYTATQLDNSTTADQTAMFNLYYDFNGYGRFKPYIGGGVGLDSRRFKRDTVQNADCYRIKVDDLTAGTTLSDVTGACGTAPTVSDPSKFTQALGVAVAFMAGVGYEVTPGITLDTGYRAIWQGASVSLSARSFDNLATSIRISDRLDHEWRTGVRVDLW